MKGFKGSGARCDEGAEVGPPAAMSDESSTLSAATRIREPCRTVSTCTARATFMHDDQAECSRCCTAAGRSRTNTIRCGRGRAVLGRHLRECSSIESEWHNLQPGWPGAWHSGFYVRSVHSYLRSRIRPPCCFFDTKTENQECNRSTLVVNHGKRSTSFCGCWNEPEYTDVEEEVAPGDSRVSLTRRQPWRQATGFAQGGQRAAG